MVNYKCGYCGNLNEGTIWCSEKHRQLWYQTQQIKGLLTLRGKSGRKGPQERAEGGARRARQWRARKT